MVHDTAFDAATVHPPTNNGRVYRIASVHGVAGLIMSFYLLFRVGRIDEIMKSFTNVGDNDKLIIHYVKLGFYTLSGLFALEFLVCGLLLIGVMQAYPKLYIPWLIYTPLFRVATLCILNVAFIYLPFATSYITFINIIGFLIIGLALYSVFIVYKNYKQLKSSNGASMFRSLV